MIKVFFLMGSHFSNAGIHSGSAFQMQADDETNDLLWQTKDFNNVIVISHAFKFGNP